MILHRPAHLSVFIALTIVALSFPARAESEKAEVKVGSSSPAQSEINADTERIMEIRLVDSFVMNNGIIIYPAAVRLDDPHR